LGAVAVTIRGYGPTGVACPPGDVGKLLHADIPTAIITRTPNESAHRGRRLNVHIAPQSDMLASNKPNPPTNPPGNGPNPGAAPLQNVSTTMAKFIGFPVNRIELGTILHDMSAAFGELTVHPSSTFPVVPGNEVSVNPNTALPPGVVLTVEGLPGAIPIVTGEFPLLNVAVTASAALIVTEQPPAPAHPAPLHPANVDPSAGIAISATTVPLAKLAEQVPVGVPVPFKLQLIPPELLVTVPVPAPAPVTVKVKLFVVKAKLATTVVAAVIVNVQVSVPSQGPAPQPVNVDPAAAVAVNVMGVPFAKLNEHVGPQLMPVGLLFTVPVPFPPRVIVSATPLDVAIMVESDAGVGVADPPPETLAIFTCGEVALAATFTVTVITG
jgi:hypothetical protein